MTTLTKGDRLTPQEHRLLSGAVHTLHDLSNAAHGTDGWALNDMVGRGLMGVSYRRPFSRYVVTSAGRDAFVSYDRTAVPICG